jgi:hypothetical protein
VANADGVLMAGVLRSEVIAFRALSVFGERDEWGTPLDLLNSIDEAGLRLCTPEERAILDAVRSVKLGYASGDPRFPFIREGIFELACAIHAERESRGESQIAGTDGAVL